MLLVLLNCILLSTSYRLTCDNFVERKSQLLLLVRSYVFSQKTAELTHVFPSHFLISFLQSHHKHTQAHRRLHCDTSTEQACVKTCRKKNNCQEPSDPCTKSCRAKCCEKDNEDIDIPDRPERKCDMEDEQACFSECKRGDGPFGKGDCRDDDLSSSEQDMCIKKCRDNCCEFEESEESRDESTPAPTPGLTESRSEPAPLITPGPTAGPTPGPTAGPTPGPTKTPTTPPESKDEVTASPTKSPTAAPKCNTNMDVSTFVLIWSVESLRRI